MLSAIKKAQSAVKRRRISTEFYSADLLPNTSTLQYCLKKRSEGFPGKNYSKGNSYSIRLPTMKVRKS